jgi:hypothetical protein
MDLLARGRKMPVGGLGTTMGVPRWATVSIERG